MARKRFFKKRKGRLGKFKRNFRKLVGRRTRRKFGSRNRITTQNVGLYSKDRCYTKFKYTFSAYNSNLTNPSLRIFRGNGAYDPDWATGGSFCPRWVEWSKFYNRYTVLGSKCSVTYENLDTMTRIVTVKPDKTSSIPANWDPREQKYAKYKYVGASGSARDLVKVSNYMSTNKIFGISTSEVKDNAGYSGQMDATSTALGVPGNQWVWWILISDASNGQVTTIKGLIQITVVYYVMMRAAKDNASYSSGINDVGADPVIAPENLIPNPE